MKRVFIVGSTGTLGRKAVDIAISLGYNIVGISGFKNYELLNEQVEKTKANFVLASSDVLEKLKVGDFKKYQIEDLDKIILEAKPNIVLFLASHITSLKAISTCMDNNIKIGIANKESIIAGGELLFDGYELDNKVLPIDSETSAIYQALLGEDRKSIKKIYVTASGGPFFGRNKEELSNVTISEVLKHPNWQMGKKISVDSANLVNKAFEIIETHFLFNIPYKNITSIIHRESIIHAIVEFIDKQLKAVISEREMDFHIQYALTHPVRQNNNFKELDFLSIKNLTFFEIDRELFPLFDFLLNYAMLGGSYLPAIVAFDEILVESFLLQKISFFEIEKFYIELMNRVEFRKLNSIEDVIDEYYKDIEKAKEYLRYKR
ncbi:MAG: hypothetical protein K6343_01870 [Caldisericaceae bacterium]